MAARYASHGALRAVRASFLPSSCLSTRIEHLCNSFSTQRLEFLVYRPSLAADVLPAVGPIDRSLLH